MGQYPAPRIEIGAADMSFKPGFFGDRRFYPWIVSSAVDKSFRPGSGETGSPLTVHKHRTESSAGSG